MRDHRGGVERDRRIFVDGLVHLGEDAVGGGVLAVERGDDGGAEELGVQLLGQRGDGLERLISQVAGDVVLGLVLQLIEQRLGDAHLGAGRARRGGQGGAEALLGLAGLAGHQTQLAVEDQHLGMLAIDALALLERCLRRLVVPFVECFDAALENRLQSLLACHGAQHTHRGFGRQAKGAFSIARFAPLTTPSYGWAWFLPSPRRGCPSCSRC